MRICLLVPHLSGGGAEIVACRWAESLAGFGHDVTLLLTHGIPGEPELPGVRVESLSGRGALGRIRALRSYIRRHRVDFVIGVMPYCNLLAVIAAARLACRVAVSEHTIHSANLKALSASSRVQWTAARVLYRHAEVCVAVSHALGAEMIAACKVSPERLWVLPNPVVESVLMPRSETGVGAPSAIHIVSPARLVGNKRLHLVIEAAKLVENAGVRVELHFFGSGPDQGRLANLARDEGLKSTFHGKVDKWWQHAPQGSVAILTSGIEGFGNVLVEAAAHGIPSVVSSKALGVADACIPGVTAQLVLGDSPADYALGIHRAAVMNPRTVFLAASEWLTRFTPEEVGRQLSAILTRSVEPKLLPPGLARFEDADSISPPQLRN